jgi:hypothetical protein
MAGKAVGEQVDSVGGVQEDIRLGQRGVADESLDREAQVSQQHKLEERDRRLSQCGVICLIDSEPLGFADSLAGSLQRHEDLEGVRVGEGGHNAVVRFPLKVELVTQEVGEV